MPSPTPFLLSVLLASSALGAGPVAPRFTMLLRAKAPEPITLLSISAESTASASGPKPGTIVFLDSAGAQQTRPLSEIIALAPPSWVPTPDTVAPTADEYGTSDLPIHRLDLTDGERFIGELTDPDVRASASSTPRPGESPVFLRHDKLGILAFPLDRVSRYWSNARRAPATGARPFSTASDTILLGNDDRLEGLVTTLGPTISIEVARPGAKAGSKTPPTEVEIGNASLVNLVNPAVPLRSLRIDLDDGTVLAADALAGDAQSGKITFRAIAAAAPSSRGVLLDISRLAGVVPDPSRIIPLASLPIAAQKPADGRLGAAPAHALPDAGAPLAAADILLPGPMTVEWTIPPGATSIVGYAQMDDRSFAWGDCTITVAIARPGAPDRELAKSRLNSTTPSLTISADLGALKPGDTLKVRTEPGQRGPIQDRVVLRRMLLLTGPGSN